MSHMEWCRSCAMMLLNLEQISNSWNIQFKSRFDYIWDELTKSHWGVSLSMRENVLLLFFRSVTQSIVEGESIYTNIPTMLAKSRNMN